MLKKSPKTIVKLAVQAKENIEFNLVVYHIDGVYQSKLIEKNVLPSSVAPLKDIVSIKLIEIHKLTPKGEGKYKRIKCRDELGDEYDSMLELIVCKEFYEYERVGFITNITRQKPFSFKVIDPTFKNTYSPDITFECLKTFNIKTTSKRPLLFEVGKKYVCDVKSPLTRKDATFGLKKALMKIGFGIEVTIVTRSYDKAKKTNRVCKKSSTTTKRVKSLGSILTKPKSTES